MNLSRNKKSTSRVSVLFAVAILIAAAIFYVISLKNEESPLSDFSGEEISGKCEIHFIDVGQGDSTLFLCGENSVLIDAGPRDSSEATRDYVCSQTDKIDYLILTHPDEDHIGGVPNVIRELKIENIIMSDAVKDTSTFDKMLTAVEKSGAKVIKAVPGNTYTAGKLKLTVLAPIGSFEGDYNDYSVVTKVEFGDTSVLVTGDAEHNSENNMLEKYGNSLRSDVLKMGHHGSSTSSGEDFFRAVSPKIAVISCGKDNSYGHPHKETLKLLRDTKTEFFRTDENGTVVLVSDGKTVGNK